MSTSIRISGYKWPDAEHPVAVHIAGGTTVITQVLVTLQEHISEIVLDRTLSEQYPEVKSICKALCPNADIMYEPEIQDPITIRTGQHQWTLEKPQDLYEFNLWYEHA